MHYWDWPLDPDNGIRMILSITVGGTLSLTAAIWSKPSFALTIIRLTKGWVKAVIWYVIITTNISMCLSALFNGGGGAPRGGAGGRGRGGAGGPAGGGGGGGSGSA